MKQSWSIGLVLLGAAALGVFALERVSGGTNGTPPRATRTGAEVQALLLAVPFELDDPYVHAWRAEQPVVKSGWLLVLEVDAEKVRPTELAQPVLCAGDETLERYHHGYEAGRVVALLPADNVFGPRASVELAARTFFFASPQLPEQIDALTISAERARAEQRGCAPFALPLVERAQRRGGAPIVVKNRVELDRLAAQLILTYSPADRARAEELLR
jgi:hypothetical protein